MRITVKDDYLRRKTLSEDFIRGRIVLSNGKEVMLYFNSRERVIEATNAFDSLPVYGLRREERIGIIEFILRKYTSFYNSILHLTTSYFIETYKLIDTTSIREVTDGKVQDLIANQKQNILEEYLSSDFASNSKYIVYRVLAKIYERVKMFPKLESYTIEINGKLKNSEKKDIVYFTKHILNKYGKYDKYTFEYEQENKSQYLLKITSIE